jgi:hypothetical protein
MNTLFQRHAKPLLKGVPGLQEIVWTTRWIAGAQLGPYNGRWKRLRQWLQDLEAAPPGPLADERRRLLVFGTPNFSEYLLAVSVVLAGRGCEVDFLWLPYLDAHGGPEVSRYERWSGRFPTPGGHDRLRMIRLHDFMPAEADEHMTALACRIAEMDACHLCFKETCEKDTNPADRKVYEHRVSRNLDCLQRLKTFTAGRHYDSALVGNGRVWEMGCFYEWCGRLGVPCTTFEMFETGNNIAASHTIPAVDWDLEAFWKADEPHVMTPDRERRVKSRMAWREDPTRQNECAFTMQAVRPEDEAVLRQNLRLDAGKRLALLCTNLGWDSAVLGHGRAFSTMKEWYLRSIAWYAGKPGWQLVIRTHPVEAVVHQPMSVADYVKQAYPQLPENVRLVLPEERVNTYGLIKIADLGLVFSSTVGLEMVIHGLPVIVAADVHYAGRGFTTDPKGPEEYFRYLERVDQSPRTGLPSTLFDLARCYSDVLFEQFPKKVPWSLWDMHGDMVRWPMAKVLAGDCPEDFLKTFDYLAGRLPG